MPALAQVSLPTIGVRQIASPGPVSSSDDAAVAECHVAVSNTHVFVAHMPRDAHDGYAVYSKAGLAWTHGDLPWGGIDPSVAYDAYNNRFLIVEGVAGDAKLAW